MKFDFMGMRYNFFAISGVLILASILLLVGKGLNYGIDFQGGNIIHVRFDDKQSESKIREVFGAMQGLYFTRDQLIIQNVAEGQGKEFIIQYPAPRVDIAEIAEMHGKIMRDLKAAMPFSDESLEVSNVGPTVGAEMKLQGLRAAFLSVIGILLYLAYRFELQSASGAVVGLVHDLLITLGFITAIGVEFDITVLAAVLTMLGYSVNDSIVVLDRIRENRKIMREADFSALINTSINQTIGRTINTSLTTLCSLFALLLLGGISIYGFALTLTFGVLIGTYSSIFIASPVLLEMTGSRLDKRRKAA
jgi:preprotein translocase subunit SecF